MKIKLLIVCFLSGISWASAEDIRDVQQVNQAVVLQAPEYLVDHEQPFFGLAFIYNMVQPIYMLDDEVIFVDPEGLVSVPAAASHVGWKSRYQLALIENHKLTAEFDNNQLKLSAVEPITLTKHVGEIDAFDQFDRIKYAHLWDWLRAIALGVEWLLNAFNQVTGHWGWSIVVLAVVMKILLLPFGLLTLKLQRQVSKNQTLLAPRLAEIKQKYQGEKAHNEMMAAHKNLGITPFYSLKPLFANFIQIPFLIAIFNVLGEMSALQGQSFLWISDLSIPDTLFQFGFAIPLFGSGFNLLPFLMTLITVLTTVFYKNDLAPAAETRKQKLNLYLMALGFFVLFYPFPASMVLYWAMANVLQFIQQKLLGN